MGGLVEVERVGKEEEAERREVEVEGLEAVGKGGWVGGWDGRWVEDRKRSGWVGGWVGE